MLAKVEAFRRLIKKKKKYYKILNLNLKTQERHKLKAILFCSIYVL
jgi:hypothetical protein